MFCVLGISLPHSLWAAALTLRGILLTNGALSFVMSRQILLLRAEMRGENKITSAVHTSPPENCVHTPLRSGLRDQSSQGEDEVCRLFVPGRRAGVRARVVSTRAWFSIRPRFYDFTKSKKINGFRRSLERCSRKNEIVYMLLSVQGHLCDSCLAFMT